jgi:glutaminyl-peptide cyclotransferase
MRTTKASLALVSGVLMLVTVGCSSQSGSANLESSSTASAAAPAPQSTAEPGPPPSQTGGFDGQQAFDFTAKLVDFGPRPPASDAIHRTQDYLLSELKSFGCAVDIDDFHSQTPIGDIAMKNIVAKVPGTGQGIILLLTHYDTLRLDNFVGAVDGGSSTGLMLELAKILCAGPKQPNSVWMAFLDGEEAQVVQDGVAQWTSTDSVYGSREMAARLALSGDLKRVKAVLLADMIGPKNLRISKDSNSTPWLTELFWKTAAKLGYKNFFVDQETAVDDDHMPFVHRQVPSVDIIDLNDYPYWHKPEDTIDKVSPHSLAIVGQVFLVSISELQMKFH